MAGFEVTLIGRFWVTPEGDQPQHGLGESDVPESMRAVRVRWYMPDQPKNSSFRKACNLMIAVGTLNFLIFVAGATYLGGDAVNGKIEGDRYYLFGVRTESGRKVYTEVSGRARLPK